MQLGFKLKLLKFKVIETCRVLPTSTERGHKNVTSVDNRHVCAIQQPGVVLQLRRMHLFESAVDIREASPGAMYRSVDQDLSIGQLRITPPQPAILFSEIVLASS